MLRSPLNNSNPEILLTSIPLRLNPIMHNLHLKTKLSKSVAGVFNFRALERCTRSAFFASLSGLCMRCICSRNLSFLLAPRKKEIIKVKGWGGGGIKTFLAFQISLHITLNCLPHVEQRKSLRSEWRSMCKRSLSGLQKAFSQCGHWKIFSEWKQRICFLT